MAFTFSFDKNVCIQCGACGDVCPVNTLDFTRPRKKTVESTNETNELDLDMTEYPIQVNKCIGCMICQEECPVSCITILKSDKEPPYAVPQGPQKTEEPAKDEFSLSSYTKTRPTKAKVKDPWGRLYTYIPRRRKSQSGTWNEPDMK